VHQLEHGWKKANVSSEHINLGKGLLLTLSKVLSLEQTNEALGRVLNTLGDPLLNNELLARQPLANILRVLLSILGAELRVVNNEALQRQAFGNDVHEVGREVHLLLALSIVVSDHTAHDEAGLVVRSLQGSLESFTSDILEVDVDTLRGELRQCLAVADLFVVKRLVEFELLLDELRLGVAADGTNYPQALALGQLADNLADSSRGGGDEDGLALLGLSDLVERGAGQKLVSCLLSSDWGEYILGGQSGHAQSAEVVAQRQVVLVVDLLEALQLVLEDHGVVLGSDMANDKLALLEVRVLALDDLGDSLVGDRAAQRESGDV
jgi:hypothetical protein